jgi:hypothetical protein
MAPEHQRWIDSLFSGLSTTEQTLMFELLGKLRNSVQQSLETEDAP